MFRDGAAIGAWQSGTVYDDFNAQAPDVFSTGGCNSSTVVDYYYHDYQVKARSDCGVGELESVRFRPSGQHKIGFDFPLTYEPAIPIGEAGLDSDLAVRLISVEPIAPETVWAVAVGSDRSEQGGVWWPTQLDDNRDGWVVFTPNSPWLPGDVVEVTAGAQTVSGREVGPVSMQFTIGNAAARS